MKDVHLVVVIVTYNGEDFIRKCIESILNSNKNADIVVIDNNSSDETVSIIRESFTSVHLIESSSNLGFGRANNIGINWAISNGAEFILLLNQDAWIEEDTLSKLIAIARKHDEYGILSPIHCQYDNNTWHAGFSRYIQMFAPLLSESAPSSIENTLYEVDFVPAALWLLRSSTLQKVGGFDPVYFMYGEDNDLASRMHSAGFKVGVVSDAKGHHLEKTYTQVPVRRMALQYFSQFVAVLKYSHHNILYRYFSALKSAILRSFSHVFKGEVRKLLATLMACRMVFCYLNRIEKSRKEIKWTQGAFLDL
ncbi:MAG: glycosyltransferase family 2 protein [Leptolyngbyaceae bacterium]|nr:glycosyltransferase family 2 protein [Leptolyngbyaceae bacterium]